MAARALVALLLVTAASALAAATASARPVVVGIGDQSAAMFDDPRLAWLGIRRARLVVPWSIATSRASAADQAWADAWLSSARGAGVEPLVSFGHEFEGVARSYLPSVREFGSAVAAFRRRWPWVRTFITWNEANICSQPTCHRPARAARFYDTLRDACSDCTVVAASLIDLPSMVTWLRRFRRAARSPVRLLGLHNYLDVNRLRTKGTRRLLQVFRGRVWITETGGVVRRRGYKARARFPESVRHAARATRYALTVPPRLSPRIERVYLFHWNAQRRDQTWDSGLIDWRNRTRPAFDVVARFLGRDPSLAP